MALTFGILAALLTGAAIWLGFLNGHAIDVLDLINNTLRHFLVLRISLQRKM